MRAKKESLVEHEPVHTPEFMKKYHQKMADLDMKDSNQARLSRSLTLWCRALNYAYGVVSSITLKVSCPQLRFGVVSSITLRLFVYLRQYFFTYIQD